MMVQAVEGGAPFLEATRLVEKNNLLQAGEGAVKAIEGETNHFWFAGKITNDANGK